MEEGERGKSGDEQNPMLVRWKNNHMKTLWQKEEGKSKSLQIKHTERK